MENKFSDFFEILCKQENILDSMSEKQFALKKTILEKNWNILETLIAEVGELSDSFTKLDEAREKEAAKMRPGEIKKYYGKFSKLRAKLLKCKAENLAILNYVDVNREFIAEVLEKAIPKTHNKNYTNKGEIVRPKASSVLVDVRG